jgi:hypothetical protein
MTNLPKTPDAAPPTYEACTVTPGTAEQEATEATTCTLTSALEFQAHDWDTSQLPAPARGG